MKSLANKIFGGFTMKSWNKSGGFTEDPQAFIFSIDNHTIYRPKKEKEAVYCH